ncbi:tRNA lysidine(34) synthetase TilS [Chromobacterium phragmitis]|uniref:tRNA lysidine(34) synthetase TilS n=1 Tax=Chromobacterium phragmitis TaxID=2202141 RepID=UPI000DECC56A|nr:tRNA lysidine(34) synthetase TilS [Chromobacterium phragmitis]AXE28602.1 tRNA lysidine(34) synthetase TilS [Chromobacterium phragmitis]
MDASRKTQPELADSLIKRWPDEMSGLFAFEVGLSGGLDSVALLSLLCEVRQRRPGFELSAVHVHHGLSANADAWAAHCQALCGALQVPLRIERVRVSAGGGESVEAAARDARYAVYRRSRAQVVALAHHQDDQAETVLLQLLRGGGPRALAAMPALRELAPGTLLWRPLLGFTRERLEAYVRERRLSWVEDESNRDTRFRRNLLRQDVLPLLAKALPHYRSHLARAAMLQADAAAMLDEVARQDLQACRAGDGLECARLRALSPPRRRQLLLAWLDAMGWPAPEPGALMEFLRQAEQAGKGASPVLTLSSGYLLRFADTLQAWPKVLDTPPAATPLLWRDGNAQLMSEWGGELAWEWRESGLPDALLASGATLAPRQGGEKLSARAGRREVKDLLREAGVPPLLRKRWPLLCAADGELLAVPGVAVAFRHAAGPGWWPLWRPSRVDW